MEQWTDQGIVLSARAHGEGGAIVTLLTEQNGRHAGYVHGGQSAKKRAMLEAGSQVKAMWKARISDSLGSFALEPERGLPTGVLENSLKLAALLSACSLCDSALPEREGHAGLYHGLLALMEALSGDALSASDDIYWGAAYVMWEISLLRELGFRLQLDKCAGGGDAQTLSYVSPKSGCAVSAAQAAPYKERLLLLPHFLRPEQAREEGAGRLADVLVGLKMTGYFLEHWAFAHHTKGVPEPRLRFEERLERKLT